MLDILNVAQTGLQASQTQVEGVMNNLANENTDGYKSRVVNVSELEHLDSRITGRGVIVDSVSRVTNVYMYQNLVEEESKLSSLTELDVMLNDIESIFHETDDSGLSADLNRYLQSIENLRTSPQNEIYKDDLKNNASIVVEDLKKLYEAIEQRETATLHRAEDTVEEINNILRSIGDVSQEIVDSVETPNDLLDRRDALEKQLANYIDVEIFREDSYELKIGGVTAVRFDTNVHALNLVEEYSPQIDKYIVEGSLPYESSIIDPLTWNDNNIVAEKQTISVSGAATGQIRFLGTDVASADGTVGHQTPDEIVDDIIADKATIIANWNTANPTREIDDIIESSNTELTIIYKNTEDNVSNISQASSSSIDFTQSVETVKGLVDSVTYMLNNEVAIKVNYGEDVDLDGDGLVDDTVDETNIVRSIISKINTNTETLGKITAYNGMYELDINGNKILTSDPAHSDYVNPDKDRYLVIESTIDGEKGKFVGEILVGDGDNLDSDGTVVDYHVEINSTLSKKGLDDIHLEIFDEEIYLKGGILKPMIDNIKTESGLNDFTDYKEKLDMFAKTLSDISATYIENEDQTYVYGTNNSEVHINSDTKISIGLFTGANVESLTFHDSMVNTLTQEKLDYLASIQWKDDIDFDGTGENNTSFSKFYQTIRVDLADDRESIIFKKESQSAVTESMTNTYEKLTKVDKDKEMVELIKFQAAYEANAKMITVVDEMLATLLGMKR
ncbi:MAG: flagellar basal body rod C-terminal domain-containing protein [Campylobacterota bacterium]|nr:flagellar basal body rod C-terminal domain-containing protein [Campylobacterota bacterium]